MAELGRQVKYGLGKETTAGTAVAATNWINHLEFDLKPVVEYANNTSAYGVIERTNSATPMREHAEGSLEAKLTADTGVLLLLGVFGSLSTGDNADANAAVKDHTLTINQNVEGQSFTLYEKSALETVRHPLTRFGETTITFELGDYIKLTSDILAKKSSSTTGTPAFESNPTEFVAKHLSVKTATSVAGLSGATAESTLESMTLTINPNLEPDWAAGSSEPYSFTSRGYEISFEMTARYNSTVYREAYKNGTDLALQVSAINTDVTIGTSANPGFVFTAPRMNITDWSPEGGLDDPRSQSMTGTIHYSPADAYALRCVATNTTAAY